KKNELYLTSTCPVNTSLTLIQSAFTYYNIHKQANDLALINPNSYTYLLLQVLDHIKNKQWLEAKVLWVKSLASYSKIVNSDEINFFGGLSEQFFKQFFQDSLDQNLIVAKTSILPKSNYFETYFKQWKEPYIVPCRSEFKTMNREKPKNIPISAFKFDKCTFLSLILAINVTGINIIDEEKYLKNKDLPEKISFSPDDVHVKQ
ncbi:23789_t:CDS:2, partial [Gigaspora margarita]